jgi:alkaline phosphatase D
MVRVHIGRRDLLRGALVLPFALAAVPACSTDDGSDPERFAHGIASGDPLPDGVILWTRVSGDGAGPIDVEWEVAEDPEMTKRVTGGTFKTDAERDFTVKVDARGLSAGKTYYYRFRALGSASRIGRTRTAPTGPVSRLRFAVVSCASYAHGYFHGYRALAALPDLDAVLHLGDYIYEYGDDEYGDVRKYDPPHEITTLDDYRRRHAHYKKDANLQAVHRQHPFVTIWDDHETANDAYKDGADNHTEGAEGAWIERKAAAQRAYREWMPYREQPTGVLFRKLSFGDLADIVLLDTRLHARTKQAGGFIGAPPAPDASRTLLGDDQAAWMEEQLRTSTAKWKLLAQQVMVGNLILDKDKQLANLDQWHGYPESRARLLSFFKDSGVKDIVVLTGDIHSSWANDLVTNPNDAAAYDPATGRGSLGVEFVTPAITSPGIPDPFLPFVESARPINPHIKYVDPVKRGFIILDVTPERTQGAWYHFQDITIEELQTPGFTTAWSVKSGETRLAQDAAAAPARTDVPALIA